VEINLFLQLVQQNHEREYHQQQIQSNNVLQLLILMHLIHQNLMLMNIILYYQYPLKTKYFTLY
jgi:hypothetical protein